VSTPPSHFVDIRASLRQVCNGKARLPWKLPLKRDKLAKIRSECRLSPLIFDPGGKVTQS